LIHFYKRKKTSSKVNFWKKYISHIFEDTVREAHQWVSITGQCAEERKCKLRM